MEHACDLAEWIGDLLFDDGTADVMLIVEGERLPAHKIILSAFCEYFRALLRGRMKESLQSEVVLEEVPLRGFKLLMSYIYTGQLKIEELDEETLIEVLSIANMYGIAKIEALLSIRLEKNLSLKNVCMIYDKARSLKLENLGEACYRFMIQEPNVTLKTEAFCNLSASALCEVLSWDTFHADEIKIFEAVLRWRAKRQSEADIGPVLKQIRLPLINTKDLVTTVKDSGLIPMEVLMDAIKTNECHAADKGFRGLLRNDVNLATSDRGSVRLIPKIRGKYIAEGSRLEYDSEEMPPFASVSSFPDATSFTLALSGAFFINHIRFRICDRDIECSYYLEVSVNLMDWARVIDYLEYNCGLLQDLYFESRVVRFVRLIVTKTNSYDDVVEITELQVDHTSELFELSHGFYAPKENVSSSAKGAIVLESLNGSETLINYEVTEDDNDAEWTSHGIGEGWIMIKLPQPYTVNSMRMLLRSDESRAYLYYVETSLDQENWTRVAKHTTNLCRSWQNITFEAHPVLYIRIVGTASTVDKVFSCSRFECPAPPNDLVRTDESESGIDMTSDD